MSSERDPLAEVIAMSTREPSTAPRLTERVRWIAADDGRVQSWSLEGAGECLRAGRSTAYLHLQRSPVTRKDLGEYSARMFVDDAYRVVPGHLAAAEKGAPRGAPAKVAATE